MSFAIISDIHVKHNQDFSYQLLLNFLNHPKIREAQEIILLGDIFDLMVGPHKNYLSSYSLFFNHLHHLLKLGKKIHYFEGNHDMHLEKLFIKEFSSQNHQFFLHKKFWQINRWGKNYFFSHGDDIEPENYSYKIYKWFVTSWVANFLANYIVSHKVLHKLGEKASEKSRKSYVLSPENILQIREKFRKGARKFFAKNLDFIICGHSHVVDFYVEQQKTYINNGYAPQSQTFIFIDENKIEIVPLT